MPPPLFEDMFIKTFAVHNYSTRQAGSLYVQYALNKRTQRNLRHYAIKLWNSLHNMSWLCDQHIQAKFENLFDRSLFYISFISCHLPNCMHPAHCISITMHPAHSTLFQLTWRWWIFCLNELGAHKFYFCPHCQSWFFNMFFFVCLLWYECHVLHFEGFSFVQLWQYFFLSLSLSLSRHRWCI